ncbi:MlaD family protein [Nocardia sp. NPDC051832]|uniref:MlaD family protein n=1 Tax=Nocardia sp. NPDC051832 TaxID=3155673 RepID=UPI00341BD884
MQELTGAEQPVSRSTAARRELTFGLFGVFALVAVLVAVGVIYVLPLGKATYTAELTEARSVRVGDEIRVAGIHVGRVQELELRADRVWMRFRIDKEVFLGDATALEVRMLTVVGGHYIAAFPAGSKPLGSTPIPAERVRLPYSLIRTLQDAATPITEVNGDTLRQNFGALQDALAGSPESLRRIGNAMETLVGMLNRQNAGVSQALTVMDEYLTAINDNRGLVGTFIREIGGLETAGLAKKAEIAESLRVTGQLLSRIAAIEPTWDIHLEPLADRLAESVPQLEDLGRRFDQALHNLGVIKARLSASITPAEGVVIDQSQVCVPLPGKACRS